MMVLDFAAMEAYAVPLVVLAGLCLFSLGVLVLAAIVK